MPQAAPRPCRHPGCVAVTHAGYCDRHKQERTNWSYDQNTTQRGYGAAWRRLRKHVLRRDNYLCQVCYQRNKLTEAEHVDHKIPKACGGTDDYANLQAICVQCHAAKTSGEGRTKSLIPDPQ